MIHKRSRVPTSKDNFRNVKLWILKDGLNKDNGDTATVEREEYSDSEYLFSSD